MSTLVNTWSCVMCGVTLENAVKSEFSVLKLSVDDIIDDGLDKRINQYRWERTQKHPKKTCSRSCGFNYTSWMRTGDPKKSYIKDDFVCDCCGKRSSGGRLLVNGNKSRFSLCRRCHRKRITIEARRLWEIFNREHRLAYKQRWLKDHPTKMRTYKRRYLKRKAKGIP